MTKVTHFIPPSVRQLADTAKSIFEHDGHLRPMVFLETPAGLAIMPVSFENAEEKEIVAAMVRAACKTLQVTAVIMITESWTLAIPSGMPAEEQKAAIDRASRDGLANHPNRAECIMVNYETAAGQKIGMMKITREGGKAAVGRLEWSDGMNGEGRFSGFLKPTKEAANG